MFCCEAIVSQIYELLSVKFSSLKMSECNRNDKYEVWLGYLIYLLLAISHVIAPHIFTIHFLQ